MGTIGIFGGTFNPPHLGHLAAARFFAQHVDKLIIVPAGQAPLKHAACVSGQVRTELCRLTFPFPVSDLEATQSGTSYTINILQTLQAQHPQARLFLLIGTDQLTQFTRWRAWEEILRLCTVCALQRDDAPLKTDLPIRLLPGFTPLHISSTRLRGMLAQGHNVSSYLTPAAYEHIKTNGLYTEPDLPAQRLHHSRCVAESADALALQYGADPAKARFAGLWHDCAKSLTLEQQVELCAQANMPLRTADLAAPKVCHAFAGAAYLAVHLGITDEELLSAVRWHTTGRAGMTLMDKIIRVADLISADRNYPDVETVRALAAQNLDAACKYIADFFVHRHKYTHPDTLAWHNQLK